MGIFTINMPDVGEGVAEAELTEWSISVGDQVQEDDVLAVVMTDKVAVEIPSSVAGKIVWLGGEPGDDIAIGAKFVQIEIDGDVEDEVVLVEEIRADIVADNSESVSKTVSNTAKSLAAPAVRKRALDAGIDLLQVTGSGPENRVTQAVLLAYISDMQTPTAAAEDGTTDIKVIGMRKKIAEKMALSKSRIPHITIVEEIDMTELEDLRAKLNNLHTETRGKLTILPFIMKAIVRAVANQPNMNARFDDQAGVIRQYDAVHLGVATQTDAGLTVPVLKNVSSLSVWQSAAELLRLSDAARSGIASKNELSGSTITITSLGPLGAIATTPIINHPEVAIVGVNKMMIRPMWDGNEFQPRKMMNISCSFDHRVIDGWDAAVFVQNLKNLLEDPVMMIMGE